MAIITVSTAHVLARLIFPTTLWGTYYHYSYFTYKDTEIER